MGRIPRFADSELAALSMPVQVIVGSHDALLDSAETRQRVAQLVPGAAVGWVEGKGHFLPSQATAIAEFLERVGETCWPADSGTGTGL